MQTNLAGTFPRTSERLSFYFGKGRMIAIIISTGNLQFLKIYLAFWEFVQYTDSGIKFYKRGYCHD